MGAFLQHRLPGSEAPHEPQNSPDRTSFRLHEKRPHADAQAIASTSISVLAKAGMSFGLRLVIS